MAGWLPAGYLLWGQAPSDTGFAPENNLNLESRACATLSLSSPITRTLALDGAAEPSVSKKTSSSTILGLNSPLLRTITLSSIITPSVEVSSPCDTSHSLDSLLDTALDFPVYLVGSIYRLHRVRCLLTRSVSLSSPIYPEHIIRSTTGKPRLVHTQDW
jgi:hypothetical protein